MKKSILMITPENKEINRFRKRQINNFIQITMPYLAAFIDEDKYEITLIDEYNQKIPFEKHYNLVVITVNTANAPHCYELSKVFRSKGSKVVFGGPHATLLPEEVREHCDVVIIGEAEGSWPRFLEEFYYGNYDSEYRCLNTPTLQGIPIPRRDLIKRRWFTKGAVFATRGCPYSCAYCNLKQIYKDSFRKRPIDEVIEDIKNSKSKFFVFWDDNFFGDIEYAKELLKELGKLNKK